MDEFNKMNIRLLGITPSLIFVLISEIRAKGILKVDFNFVKHSMAKVICQILFIFRFFEVLKKYVICI